ncbi:hypothetical protein TWF506_003195 [Arthrobotrys conoides]|uniref:Phospholipase/carboxylesterase/thioesterase domain-containing protein n=1 Tax=Arthrobotrys conoides TaxID=74498 RepID=A0AAN8N8J1_9PEZI
MKHDYPEPFVVDASSSHTHTCILLHGRGSNGPKFGEALLSSQTSNNITFKSAFPPGTKFIFPTAKKRRSIIFKRIPINQWFDNYSLDNPGIREHLQVDGLRETTEVIHQIIRDEVSGGIDLGNIVLGGLSQGCAASVYALLTFEGRVGAYVGMSGWFPFVKYVNESLGGEEEKSGVEQVDEGVFNINTHGVGIGGFDNAEQEEDNQELEDEDEDEDEEEEEEDSDEEDDETDDDEVPTGNNHTEIPKPTTTTSSNNPLKVIEALNFLRENIDFPLLDSTVENLPCLKTPVFLGHGEEDEKVNVSLGRQTRDALLGLSMDVTWKLYADFGHWYKVPDEIDDIVAFLQKNIDSLS